ncbi:MAG: GAF domain-containing protein [Chloroflexota bacterium]|nr:GAF domain-containing protein [Chloroflexota bacterium]
MPSQALSEHEFVYDLLNELTGVTSPDEWLEVVSTYPRSRGASGGTLLWVGSDRTDGEPNWQEVAALWFTDGQPRATIGTRLPLEPFWQQTGGWFANPHDPTFIEDIETSPLLEDTMRADYLERGVRALVFMPMLIEGRWVSGFGFRWSQPQQFTPEDRTLYNAIMRHAGPVINAVRLLQDNRDRAHRAEQVAAVNTALSKARDEAEILNAICNFATPNGATSLVLFYINLDTANQPVEMTIAATAGEDAVPNLVGQVFPMSGIGEQLLAASTETNAAGDSPVYFDDYETDPRLDETARVVTRAWGVKSGIGLPLRSGGQWQGMIGVNWRNAHMFTYNEREIYEQLLPTIASVVASRRAFLETQALQEEATFLRELAEAINAATNFQDVCDAIAQLYDRCEGLTLQFFEQFDYDRASYFEIVAAACYPDESYREVIGSRFPIANFPVTETMRHERMWVFEDLGSDPRIDPVTRETWTSMGTWAVIGISFLRGKQWLGGIGFRFTTPQTFSEMERQRIRGMGDLVQAAVERILSQQNIETARHAAEAARQESDYLRALAMAVNSATTYQDVIDAVAELMHDAEGVLLDIWETFDYRTSDYFDVLAASAKPTSVLRSITGMRFTEEQFPIIRLIYEDRYWAIEDTHDDERVDPVTRASWDALDTRAVMALMLHRGERWLGGISFHYRQPRAFNEREIRMHLSIGDLVQAAVERIRLQVETDAARQESDALYDLAEQVNAARTYGDIVLAISDIMEDYSGALVAVANNFDASNATAFNLAVLVQKEDGTRELIEQVLPIASIPMLNTMRGQRLWVMENIESDPRVDVTSRDTYETFLNMRAFIGISYNPIDTSQIVGGFGYRYLEPRTFSERERRLLLGVGDLVQAAIERIRSQEETDAARRRAETLASMTAALASAADEDDILDALALLPRLQPGSYISVHYPVFGTEGELIGFQMQASLNPDGSHAPRDKWMEIVFKVEDFGLLTRIQRYPDKIVYLENYLTDTRPEFRDTRALAELHGWLAQICIPLWLGGRWQGNVQFLWREPLQFDNDMRLMLDTLKPTLTSVVNARRSYLAAEQARRETEQRVEELQTFAQMSGAAVSLLDESKLVMEFTRLARMRFQPLEVALYLLDDKQLLQRAAIENLSDQEVIALNADHPVAQSVRLRQGVIVNDWMSDDLISSVHVGAVRGHTAICMVAAPMAVRDQLIGALGVRAPQGMRLGDAHLRMMSTLADLIAVAIHNVRYYQQAQELAALEERTRLARELHDSVSQALYGIGLGAQTLRRHLERNDIDKLKGPLEYVISLAEAGLTEMRALIFELRPESLENEGMITALAKQGASIEARHNISVQLELGEEPVMSVEKKESLYRIAREALHNVVKHAAATQIVLRLQHEPEGLVLEVRDDGLGFDTAQDFPGHLGLQSMRERVAKLGGRLTIASTPGAGTTIRAVLHHSESPPKV